jgi:hypothetical protein
VPWLSFARPGYILWFFSQLVGGIKLLIKNEHHHFFLLSRKLRDKSGRKEIDDVRYEYKALPPFLSSPFYKTNEGIFKVYLLSSISEAL